PEDFDRLVRELQEAHGPGGTWNVLYLWAADTDIDVDRAGAVALEAPVHFARALGLHRGTAPTRLAVVTQGLARVGGTETQSPARALALGPVKTLPLEYPALSASVIDIEDAVAEFEQVVAELRASLPRSFVACRGATRFVEDVETLAADGADAGGGPRGLRPGGVYVITGGLGGVGRAVAAWMARTYQARLVLVGRTPLPERDDWAALESEPGTDAETRERMGAVRELESSGAQVLVEACDVADRAALAEAVARAELRFGPIQGVVHAAGLAGGGLAQFRDVEAMREVLAPKVNGTLALASVFGGRQLDFFAVFSSTAALLGNLGQVDYCAANAFLDAWADSPDAPGHVVSVAWDVWRDVGMAAAERLPSVLREAHAGHVQSGVSAAEALSVLERALFAGERRVVVSTENLPDRLERGARRHQRQTEEEPGDGGKRSQAETESVLTAIWKDLFGRAHIERDANFFELGGDSLLIIEAGRQIKQRLEVSLAVADLFKFPTIARLAEHLAPASSAQDSEAPSTTVRPAAESSDIAVIGMAARFPGAKNVDEFWENLVAGVESLVPTDEPAKEGADGQGQYVPVAGTADGVDQFDPTLFGYTAREAEIMDPQQRLLLMCAYEALEDAGHAPRGQSGKVAVYAGVAMSSYLLNNLIPRRDSSNIDPMAVSLGNDKDFAATQISYRLNLNGPSVSVGTACSTSLVAIAHACRSLISGESDMALAGGAKVRVPEHSGYWFHDGGILSPDGHCRAFDADGQGTVFSSGGGVVVLKRLSDAVRDGDAIRAVIRGSA
ncbi:SDR family NAD(P)-dependent oxidoreductase, partial [Streptomyces globisporus]